MIRNLAPVMPILMPAAILSILPVLFLSYRNRPDTFYLNLAGLALFVLGLLVTLLVEVPIDNKIMNSTIAMLPDNWESLRDRWEKFHVIRTMASVAGFALLLVGAIFFSN